MLSLNRQILLILVTLAIAAGQSIVFTVLPPLGREVGLSEFQITLIISSSAFVFAVSAPFWGRISDKRGRKFALLVGLWGYAIGSLLFALAFEAGHLAIFTQTALILVIVAIRTAQASVMSATPTAVMAYVADNTAIEQRAKVLARIGAGNNIGTIIGPVIAGAIAIIGLTAPLYFSAVFAAVGAIAISISLENTSMDRCTKHHEEAKISLVDPRIRVWLLTGVICFFSFAANQQTLAFALQDRFSLSSAETVQATGAMLMCLAISSLFSQSVILQRYDIEPIRAVVWGVASSTLGYIAMIMAENSLFLYGVSMTLIGLGLGFVMPNIATLCSSAVTTKQQGIVAGYTSSIPAMGFVLGPVSGGALYQIAPVLPQQLAVALMAITLAALVFMTKRDPSPQQRRQ